LLCYDSPDFNAETSFRFTYTREEVSLRFSMKPIFLFSTIFSLVSSVAFGSGFSIFEQGAKATGMAGAFVATADDPSAIFFNPAGLAQQRHLTLLAGGTAINFANEFRGASNDEFTSGVKAEYVHHTFVPPNAYVAIPIGQNLTFGLGTFAAFGLRTNWADPYPGRFISKDANVKTLSVEPALAWQTSDGRLAIGAGAEYRRSHIILARNQGAFNPFTQRFVDVASAYLGSDWDNAWGYNVGILYKPGTWRLGASYRSQMTIDYKGTATFTQIPSGNAQFDAIVKAGLPPQQAISTSIDYPAMSAIGAAYTGIPNWEIEGDLTLTTWSRFKALDVSFATTPAVNIHRVENWKDTYAYRVGANRSIGTDWAVRLGAVYDKNPEPTDVVGPLLPDSDRIGVTFGLGYHAGPFIVDVSDMVLHFQKRSTDGQSSDNFNGTYKTDANLISVNVGYKF
jgi:long-chain fatty acid transport protein